MSGAVLMVQGTASSVGKGCRPPAGAPVASRDAEYDVLADALATHLDWELVCALAGVQAARPPRGRDAVAAAPRDG